MSSDSTPLNEENRMERVVSLTKRRGFIFPGSDIYGGLANSWDYGPLGVELVNNLKQAWWRRFVHAVPNIYGVDAAILMNTKVWEASGHVDTFNDPLVDCKNCKARHRADHIVEDYQNTDFTTVECPNCGETSLTPPRQFNMMFRTSVGAMEESANTVYLRPETAQGIFTNFNNVVDTMRPKIPFGIAQIGKAFRNEITPGNFTFRTLEFEQMEIEYFIDAEHWEAEFENWLTAMHAFAEEIGLDQERVHDLEVEGEELAHYSKRTVDVEFDFPFGRKELWGLAYRTNYDLTQHQEHSGQSMDFHNQQENTKVIPHVIEPSMGVTRTALALLLSAYTEEEVSTANGETDTRVVMKFAYDIAPYKVAILPLSKKEELRAPCHALYQELSRHMSVMYDETQSIGKRYRRQDEIGTPFCVTVDFDTLEDNAVTVRNRDTMEQERIPMSEVHQYIIKQIS